MTRKADGIRRRWCKPSHPVGVGAHGYEITLYKSQIWRPRYAGQVYKL